MGLFGNDQEQDVRLDAIEDWLQGLTKVVQQHQLNTAELRLDLLKLQTGLDQKLSEDDFDPAVMQLSDKITEARVVAQQAAEAAGEGWAKIQQSAINSLEDLNNELARAAEGLDKN
jgi:hypothetical protein